MANLESVFEEFARFLDKVPAERLLEGVSVGEEGPFLAYHFKRLIGWTELRSSDIAQVHSDLFRRMDDVLFPWHIFSHGGLPSHFWDRVTMSWTTW